MIEGFVLAGGKSRRFGEDKLLYFLGGKRLVEHTLDALRAVCERVCIVAKSAEKFSFLKDVEVLQDVLEKQFALSGVHTALKNLKGERALVVAGDMPLLKEKLLKELIKSSEAPLTLFRTKGKLQPLLAVYYKELLPRLEDYMKKGGERLVDFVEGTLRKEISEEKAKECDPELLSFTNVNTKEDAELVLSRGLIPE